MSTINVDGKDYTIVQTIEVFWCGWECDNYAWLVKVGHENKLVTTNHGYKEFTEKSFLENKIKEYEDAILQTKNMLDKLNCCEETHDGLRKN